ncbi:hypothetical protein CF394_07980 [Tetzosporium hominis]|uniref:Uncharacterized protein n=1 Tax=Tetzosporium hominis TaxID=2020506 RepID=A0A264W3M5_9BACL|nr:hypothetical protein [Tetzosporium hominis]OZS78161.1 hypothetical protein CF394_07980 [Tetzosporium hominis]
MFTFGFTDFLSLLISAFIILPIVVFVRETGYIVASLFFGVKNPRITIGSGPRLFKLGILDVRKYYHLYSWFSYDDLAHKNRWIYVVIYAAPILSNILVGIVVNLLVVNGVLDDTLAFWDRFVFYIFYYVLFDIVPMRMLNGKPNNGMIIYEMLRYGKRTDYCPEPFLPSTTESEKEIKKSQR